MYTKSANYLLFRAVMSGSSVGIEQALREGADINAVNHNGNTALGMALTCRNMKMVSLLLARGASLQMVNRQVLQAFSSQEFSFSSTQNMARRARAHLNFDAPIVGCTPEEAARRQILSEFNPEFGCGIQ